ncbi:MAG: Type I-E CRISPR-associated protein Cas5/CasD [Oscillospiraceae bacterium]|jgi:CRISPR system Cascade subunit CasD
MAQTIPILVLRLEGVLQSWGEHSKWNWRDTADMPTKSGVIGLLGCALGLERSSPQLAELSRELTIAVRADRPGRQMTDFQSVQSDRLLKANGELRSGGNTLISFRSYLQDACFTVVLTGEDKILKKLEQALKKPKWPIYLGRKSCVPTRPVLDKITYEYTTLEEALQKLPRAKRSGEKQENASVLIETDIDIDEKQNQNGTQYLRTDGIAPGQRNFLCRRVIRKPITIKEANHVPEQNTTGSP